MTRNNIYISTQARPSDIDTLIDFCTKELVGIELSSGCDLGINSFFDILAQTNLRFRFHNYFPLPNKPFVIDVASSDFENRKRSIDFIKRNLLVSKKLNLGYYSFHAGFTTSPLPRELGKTFDKKTLNKQLVNDSLDRFYSSMEALIQFSYDLGIDLLIENNVVGPNNFINGYSVAHLSNHEEIVSFFQAFGSTKVGLLLDTAHYYISENSSSQESFDSNRVLELIDFTKVLHHSATCGLKDCNNIIDKSYWFLKYVHEFTNCDHVLEIRNITNESIKNCINVLEGSMH